MIEQKGYFMEKSNVIYEKKFDHFTDDDYKHVCDEATAETDIPSWRDSSVFCKQLVENTVRIVIPYRMENQEFFIAQAKEIAEQNEIDTTIMEYEDRLIAEFRIGDSSTNFGIKGIIEYADDVFFGCDKGEVVLSVIYYTHATYRSGTKITPDSGHP